MDFLIHVILHELKGIFLETVWNIGMCMDFFVVSSIPLYVDASS